VTDVPRPDAVVIMQHETSEVLLYTGQCTSKYGHQNNSFVEWTAFCVAFNGTQRFEVLTALKV